MKWLFIKANLAATVLLLAAAYINVVFALEGGDVLPGWMRYVWLGLGAESALWVGFGIGCLIAHFADMPPRRRGYITYSEKYGWVDEGGRRP